MWGFILALGVFAFGVTVFVGYAANVSAANYFNSTCLMANAEVVGHQTEVASGIRRLLVKVPDFGDDEVYDFIVSASNVRTEYPKGSVVNVKYVRKGKSVEMRVAGDRGVDPAVTASQLSAVWKMAIGLSFVLLCACMAMKSLGYISW